MNGATLQASCMNRRPAVLMQSLKDVLAPSRGTTSNITLSFIRMPTTCFDLSIEEPCVEEPQNPLPRPPLFWVAFTGSGGDEETVGPLAPRLERGYPILEAPLPSWAQLLQLDKSEAGVRVSVHHGADSGNRMLIAFEGVDGGDELRIHRESPPPSLPPLPPPALPPPPAPPPLTFSFAQMTNVCAPLPP